MSKSLIFLELSSYYLRLIREEGGKGRRAVPVPSRRAAQLDCTGSVDRAKASAEPAGQPQQEEEEEEDHKCVFINRTGETARLWQS